MKAANYGSFSIGPGYAASVIILEHFINYPQDMEKVLADLPRSKATEHYPAFYPEYFHALTTSTKLAQALPDLARRLGEVDKIKSEKTLLCHPKEQYIAECRSEWEAYTKMMRSQGQIPADKPDIPYPYTVELVDELIQDAMDALIAQYGKRGA